MWCCNQGGYIYSMISLETHCAYWLLYLGLLPAAWAAQHCTLHLTKYTEEKKVLYPVHLVWPMVQDGPTHKNLTSASGQSLQPTSLDFYCYCWENPVSPHTLRLQFHDVIVSLVIFALYIGHWLQLTRKYSRRSCVLVALKTDEVHCRPSSPYEVTRTGHHGWRCIPQKLFMSQRLRPCTWHPQLRPGTCLAVLDASNVSRLRFFKAVVWNPLGEDIGQKNTSMSPVFTDGPVWKSWHSWSLNLH